MANQFTAKIRFDPVAWRARDKESGAVLTVVDNGPGKVSWSIKRYGATPPFFEEGGICNTPSAGRAACRRALERNIAPKKKVKRASKGR